MVIERHLYGCRAEPGQVRTSRLAAHHRKTARFIRRGAKSVVTRTNVVQ